MDPQDRLSTCPIGEADGHLPIEAPGAQEGRVEHVGAVRCRDDDDVRVGVEAIHLDEEMVERLLPLVVAATEARPTLPSDGIDLVDEHDRRGGRLCLREQVADPARADAHE